MRYLLLTIVTGSLVSAAAAQSSPPEPPAAAQHRYSLTTAGENVLMIDHQTGDTWMLSPERRVWEPIRREEQQQTDAGKVDPASAGLKEDLARLQIEELLLLESYSPQHPDVQRIRKKIELTRRFLEQGSGDSVASSAPETTNPIVKEFFDKLPTLPPEAYEELRPLVIEYQGALHAYGDQHPETRAIEGKIKLLFAFYEQIYKEQAAAELSENLAALQAEEQLFLKRLGPEHPKLDSIRQQIEQTRTSLSKLDDSTTDQE